MRTKKMNVSKYGKYEEIPSTYCALCREYLPRPIHDEEENAAATEMVDALAVFQELNSEQSDYLEAVSHFVNEYEREDGVEISGLDALRFLLKEHEMSGTDLARILGSSRMLGPMILRGERSITADHARKLGAYFKVDPGLFL